MNKTYVNSTNNETLFFPFQYNIVHNMELGRPRFIMRDVTNNMGRATNYDFIVIKIRSVASLSSIHSEVLTVAVVVVLWSQPG